MHAIQKQQILEQLQLLWLNSTDASTYLTLLTLGASTLRQLVEATWQHRITTHDSIWRLVKKWLVLETRSGKRKLVYPQDVTRLQELVERKKSEVQSLQDTVNTTITLLQSLHLQSDTLPQVRISKWRQWIKDMLSEIRNSKTSQVSVLSDSRHFDELISIDFLKTLSTTRSSLDIILPNWFEHFLFSAQARGLTVTASTLDPEIQRKWGMTLWDDTVALHAYEWMYITTTLITNQAISIMMRSLFKSHITKNS